MHATRSFMLAALAALGAAAQAADAPAVGLDGASSPSGKPTLATAANVASFEARRVELERAAHEELAQAQARAEALREFRLTITAKAGTEGKLFGSVGTADIAEAATRAGHALARNEVRLPAGPLRITGEHVVTVHLHADVDVEMPVTILAEEAA